MEVLDQLRIAEGTLFHYESSKKLFLDLKGVVLDSMERGNSSGYESYLAGVVHDSTEVRAALSTCPDMPKRLAQVSLLYAKMTKIGTSSYASPTVETFLQAVFKSLVKLKVVQKNEFLDMDPIKQDYILRDIFRAALVPDGESIISSPSSVVPPPEVVPEAQVLPPSPPSPTPPSSPPDASNDAFPSLSESPFLSISARSEKSVTSILSRHTESMKQLRPKKIQLESAVLE